MGKDDAKAVAVTEEIEITPQMIEAGVAALQTYRLDGDDAALVEAVYSAMARRVPGTRASNTLPGGGQYCERT